MDTPDTNSRPDTKGVSPLVRAIARRKPSLRRWATRKRQLLLARSKLLLAARRKGLFKCQIRELLAQEGLSVSRWLLDDVLRELEAVPPAPAKPKPAARQ